MNPYRDMYLQLFNLVTDTITALQKVQQECEAIFMENDPMIEYPPPGE